MRNITHPGIARLLINLHINGRAVVRVLADLQTSIQVDSQLNTLAVKGIEVRGIDPERQPVEGDLLFHNKYVVIDGKTVVHGSADWTPRIAMSYETIFITEQEFVAEKFAEQFKYLWNKSIELRSIVVSTRN